MSEYTLREYTDEEYQSDLRKEISENGLIKSVEKRLDEINDISSVLSYIPHRQIQEQMCEIMDLMKLKEHKDGN